MKRFGFASGFARGFVLVALVVGAGTARAKTNLSIQIGWESIYRAGRWTPLYLTVSDPMTRQVNLQVSAPHDGIFSMDIRQSFTIGPEERTYPIYCPTTYDLEDLTVTIRDAETDKLLARYVRDLSDPMTALRGMPIRPSDVLVGVSGRKSSLNVLRRTNGANSSFYVGYLDPLLLPGTTVGYDALDVLVLNEPDLNRLSAEQQEAIANWVRAGGSLLMWPGDGPIPPSGPIVQILPAKIGDTQSVELSDATLKKFKLHDRFKRIRARELTPIGEAKAFAVFPGENDLLAYGKPVGFGKTVLLPIDPSEFFYVQSPVETNFWRPIMTQANVEMKEPDQNENNSYSYSGDDYRTGNALRSNIELMGSIPGVGSFDFTYVAIVLIGLMLIVGPIDWFVLKRLGHQPWTWATTTGWIALVTIGAIYIGYLFKSGDLHYRTLHLIDQAGGTSVATTDLVCVYSPRSRIYNITSEPNVWWQPVGDLTYFRSGGMHTDLPFHQDYQGNHPLGLAIPVWNLRFMRGDSFETGPAIVDSELKLASNAHLTGTITNHGDSAIEEIKVVARGGVFDCKNLVIAPGETKTIDAGLEAPGTTFNTQPVDQGNGYYGYYAQVAPVDESKLYGTVSDLTPGRADAIKQAVNGGQRVCIYAKMKDPKPTVKLEDGQNPIEKHWQVVRALVPVKH